MTRKKQLTQKQLVVIDDMFNGELDEQAVLARHKVSRKVYNKWLADGEFNAELARRIATSRLQGEVLIAKYSMLAAARLVQLTESEKGETARKACLDIISLLKGLTDKAQQPAAEQRCKGEKVVQPLTADTAGRLLAALAETEKKKQ